MDLITLAMAKAYSNSKGGYVEQSRKIFNIALTDGSNYDVVVTGKELTVGETYTVITESGSFSAVCKDFDGGALLGNLASINPSGENTGESFVVYVGVEKGEAYGVAVDQNGGSFIKVITPETIHPIDPKYLPGVCLPVVELNIDAIIGEEVAFTDAENAALTACIGMPFILKSGNSTVSTSIVMEYLGGGNEHSFASGNTTLHTNNGGETWTVINA